MDHATALRNGLPPVPVRVGTLPVDERGYPVPWFVAWIGGKPDFRIADSAKMLAAVRGRRCWICGLPIIGRDCTFVVGPMCGVNRISSEPPCHHDCATFAAKACPFLVRPAAKRRIAGVPGEVMDPPGLTIKRNPGVALLWRTDGYAIVPVEGGGWLFRMRPAHEITWLAEGREATREEVLHSLLTGVPFLREQAELDGAEGVASLADALREAAVALDVPELAEAA